MCTCVSGPQFLHLLKSRIKALKRHLGRVRIVYEVFDTNETTKKARHSCWKGGNDTGGGVLEKGRHSDFTAIGSAIFKTYIFIA